MLTADVDGSDDDKQMAWATTENDDNQNEGMPSSTFQILILAYFKIALHLIHNGNITLPFLDNWNDLVKAKVTLNWNGIGDKFTIMFLIANTSDKQNENSRWSQSVLNIYNENITSSPVEESKQEASAESHSLIKNSSSFNNIKETLNPFEKDSSNSISNLLELFKSIVYKITVVGLPWTQMPSGSNMVKMLNINSMFKKYGYEEEYYESMFLTGLTMISSRKYVQSVEFFRHIQKHIFNTLNDIPDEVSKTKWNKINPYKTNVQVISETKSVKSNSSAQSQNSTKAKFSALIQKAIKLEILIADCCSQHSQVKEKLDAFKNATRLFKIKSLEKFKEIYPPKTYISINQSFGEPKMHLGQYLQEEDIYSELLKLQPGLLKLIMVR